MNTKSIIILAVIYWSVCWNALQDRIMGELLARIRRISWSFWNKWNNWTPAEKKWHVYKWLSTYAVWGGGWILSLLSSPLSDLSIGVHIIFIPLCWISWKYIYNNGWEW